MKIREISGLYVLGDLAPHYSVQMGHTHAIHPRNRETDRRRRESGHKKRQFRKRDLFGQGVNHAQDNPRYDIAAGRSFRPASRPAVPSCAISPASMNKNE